jgi:hypothetical protein
MIVDEKCGIEVTEGGRFVRRIADRMNFGKNTRKTALDEIERMGRESGFA